MAIQNRYDFVLLFDVKDGNPNGDPDAGNLPRLDSETGQGLVTDVCIKRKIRNYVQLLKKYQRPFDIYVKEKAVLGRSHQEAFANLGIELGEESRVEVTDELRNDLNEFRNEYSLPPGIDFEEDDDEKAFLILSADADAKSIKSQLKEMKIPKKIKDLINNLFKNSKSRRPKSEEVEKGRQEMCRIFYDIRTFGAVMSLKSAPNCGQVRGPVQMTFARSIDPIVISEHSLTRMAVATEAEAEKQHGDNRTMGRKFTVPYGLYMAHGFISANLASKTGFDEADLQLFWEALVYMFEHDRSASRGEMKTCGLYIFKHNSPLGNAHAHELFNLIQVKRRTETSPRSFSDYEVTIDRGQLPEGVELTEFYQLNKKASDCLGTAPHKLTDQLTPVE